MDDKDFVGTITATEARKSIFEDVLGFKQGDLAGLTIGFKYNFELNWTELNHIIRFTLIILY